MSYSVIRCPNCGSLEVSKRSDGSYYCAACTATFRLENEDNDKKYKTLNGMKNNFNYYILPDIYNKEQFLRNTLIGMINDKNISYKVLEGNISEINDNISHYLIVDIDADASITATVGLNKDVPYTDYEYVNNNGNRMKVPVTKMKKVMEYNPYSSTIFTSGEGINLIDGVNSYNDTDFKYNLIYSFYNNADIKPVMNLGIDVTDELINKSYEEARNIIYENLLPRCDEIKDIKHYIKPTSYCGYIIQMHGYEFKINTNNNINYMIYGSSFIPSFVSDIPLEKTEIPNKESLEQDIKNKYKAKITLFKILPIVCFVLVFITGFTFPFIVGQLQENTLFLFIPMILLFILIPISAVLFRFFKIKQDKEINDTVEKTINNIDKENKSKKIELANNILNKLNLNSINEGELNKKEENI